jgi:tetratricopeptide (TPR) repeat protein
MKSIYIHSSVFERYIGIISFILLSFVQISCKKFLEAKPDQTLNTPSALKDLQELMDADRQLNNVVWPDLPELASDNFYLTYGDWTSLAFGIQTNYIWDADASLPSSWYYRPVLYANTVLDNIDKIIITENNKDEWYSVKGAAFFFRGYSFYHTAELYSKPYNLTSASTDLGIPLRLTAGIDEVSVRSTNQQTYEQIISDLKNAVSLLPVNSLYPTRPNKPAAFGALARVYLSMRDYVQAGLYADSCLQLHNSLLDYNSLDSSAAAPIATFNQEVIFHNTTVGSSSFSPSRCKVDSNLYLSYTANDLRKVIFFKNNGNGTYTFKGTYNGTNSPSNAVLFNGIVTDEMYLIRAECAARSGNKDSAMADLNRLLAKRWKTGTFVSFTATDIPEALNKVLTERRKELCFRALRWSDLRRFNLENANITLTRVLNGQVYTLPPNDLRWVMLIPIDVIARTGMQQNPR